MYVIGHAYVLASTTKRVSLELDCDALTVKKSCFAHLKGNYQQH